MKFANDPFFWAFISMFALVSSFQIVSGKSLGKHPIFGIFVISLFALGRIILVLPSLPQPRIELNGWNWIAGGIIFTAGVIFSSPALSIRPFSAPSQKINLKTTGLYRFVRNPIYLGEILWCLGWSIMFRSIIGVVLVPLWWAGLSSLVLVEEENLERVLGQSYLDYKKRVRSRILPGLPI
jgi:protein-S-isoprenylcysteine O-methyltransferase Ste14